MLMSQKMMDEVERAVLEWLVECELELLPASTTLGEYRRAEQLLRKMLPGTAIYQLAVMRVHIIHALAPWN